MPLQSLPDLLSPPGESPIPRPVPSLATKSSPTSSPTPPTKSLALRRRPPPNQPSPIPSFLTCNFCEPAHATPPEQPQHGDKHTPAIYNSDAGCEVKPFLEDPPVKITPSPDPWGPYLRNGCERHEFEQYSMQRAEYRRRLQEQEEDDDDEEEEEDDDDEEEEEEEDEFKHLRYGKWADTPYGPGKGCEDWLMSPGKAEWLRNLERGVNTISEEVLNPRIDPIRIADNSSTTISPTPQKETSSTASHF